MWVNQGLGYFFFHAGWLKFDGQPPTSSKPMTSCMGLDGKARCLAKGA